MITGTLKYVTGYTGYSGDVSEQSGNYLALKVSAAAGATTTVGYVGGNSVTLDSDMNIVIRVTDLTKTLIIKSTLSGETTSQTYSLRGLTLETA